VVFVLLVPRGIVPSLGDLIDIAWRRLRRAPPTRAPKPAAVPAAAAASKDVPHPMPATEPAP
jgi:branched-chain amino acid transport system permease protein